MMKSSHICSNINHAIYYLMTGAYPGAVKVGNMGELLDTMIVLPKDASVLQGAAMIAVTWILTVLKEFQVELVHEDHEDSCQLCKRMKFK